MGRQCYKRNSPSNVVDDTANHYATVVDIDHRGVGNKIFGVEAYEVETSQPVKSLDF